MSDVIESKETLAFRQRLRDLMDDCGGITAFSERTGVPYQTARQYLKKSEPTRPVILKIAEKMTINPNWLLCGEGNKKNAKITVIAQKESEYFRHELNRRLSSDEKINDLANIAEMTPSRLMQLRQSGEPSLSEAIRICRALNIDTFPNPPKTEFTDFIILPELDPVACQAMLFTDFDFRDTHKLIHSTESDILKPGKIALKKSELDTKFYGNSNSLVCYRMPDDKMHPDIRQGSLVILDLGEQVLDDGEFFLSRFEGKLAIHLARKNQDGKWQLKRSESDNPVAYDSQYLYQNGAIFGKKVGLALS